MRFEVWGLGFGVWGLGFGVWGLGFGVWGLGYDLWALTFGLLGAQGLGLGGIPQKKGTQYTHLAILSTDSRIHATIK